MDFSQLSMLEAACKIMEGKNGPFNLVQLIEETLKAKGLEDSTGELTAQLYIDITTSSKFVYMGNDCWDLKCRQSLDEYDKDGSVYNEGQYEDDDEDDRTSADFETDTDDFDSDDEDDEDEDKEYEGESEFEEESDDDEDYSDQDDAEFHEVDEEDNFEDDDFDEDDYNDKMDDFESLYDEK